MPEEHCNLEIATTWAVESKLQGNLPRHAHIAGTPNGGEGKTGGGPVPSSGLRLWGRL